MQTLTGAGQHTQSFAGFTHMAHNTPYLDRYLDGEHKAVWTELLALGDKVEVPPLRNDAEAVASEIVRRARHNIEVLYERLQKLGYQFANPSSAFLPAGPDAGNKIAEIEKNLGKLPLVVRIWYESIASVDFSQADEQLKGPTGPDINGLGMNPAMVMNNLDLCWKEWLAYCNRDDERRKDLALMKVEHPDWYANVPDFEKEDRLRKPFLFTGGSASNCETKGIILPCGNIDGVLYNDGGGDMYLVNVLRSCFAWGGFPCCQYYVKRKKPLLFYARPNIEKLMPLLRDGLLAV
jgi:hypothetical protein